MEFDFLYFGVNPENEELFNLVFLAQLFHKDLRRVEVAQEVPELSHEAFLISKEAYKSKRLANERETKNFLSRKYIPIETTS